MDRLVEYEQVLDKDKNVSCELIALMYGKCVLFSELNALLI